MNNSNKNEAIEVVYDAMENKSYEFLSEAVINANIGNKKLSSSDTILKILPVRFCEGKKPNNNAEIGFNISEICRTPSELTEKIVIFVDGERLDVKTIRDYIQEKHEFYFSPEQIIGLNPGAQLKSKMRSIDFLLQPKTSDASPKPRMLSYISIRIIYMKPMEVIFFFVVAAEAFKSKECKA